MASTDLSLSYKQDIWDVKCSIEEKSASGNYRTISLKLEVRTKDFTGGRDGGYHVDCEEGGDISEKSCIVPGSSQDRFVLYDETFDVYVAPGKTYADISFDFEIHFYSSSAGANRTLSGTIRRVSGLSVISGVTISSAKDIHFGDNVSISWTPPATSFAYKLEFTMGSYSYTTEVITPNQTTLYTYTGLQVPFEAADNIPNSVFGTMSVTIIQYKNSDATETVGSSVTENFKVSLPDSVVPTIGICIASIDNSNNAVVASWGVGLVGYSKIKIVATANGIYGSTIKNFTISGDYTTTVSGSFLSYIGETISTSGNKEFVITCTDSRGRKSSIKSTNEVSILPYTPPSLTSLSTSKEEYGDANPSNDRMIVTATWDYDTVNGYNTATGIAYYKESSATDWVPHSGTVKNNTPFTLSDLHLNETKSYNIKVVVTDKVGNSSDKSAFSSTTQVLLDFRAGGKGLGIGKICESDGMEVSMDATFYNNVYIRSDSDTLLLADYIRSVVGLGDIINTIYPVGSIYMSMSNRTPAELFGGTWEQICGRFLLSAGSNLANTTTDFGALPANSISRPAGEMGGEVNHQLTIDEMPAHDHGGVRRSDNSKSGTGSQGASSGSADAAYETNDKGGSMSHNNMPPYLVVYMWERVA
jgi:hypothetical protein